MYIYFIFYLFNEFIIGVVPLSSSFSIDYLTTPHPHQQHQVYRPACLALQFRWTYTFLVKFPVCTIDLFTRILVAWNQAELSDCLYLMCYRHSLCAAEGGVGHVSAQPKIADTWCVTCSNRTAPWSCKTHTNVHSTVYKTSPFHKGSARKRDSSQRNTRYPTLSTIRRYCYVLLLELGLLFGPQHQSAQWAVPHSVLCAFY